MASNDDEFILDPSCHAKQQRSDSASAPPKPSSVSDNRHRTSVPTIDDAVDKKNGSKVFDCGRIDTVAVSDKRPDHLSGILLRGNGTESIDSPVVGSESGCGRATHWLINMKCTDGSLATFSFFVGVAAILLQVMSLGSDNWLYTIEPRPAGNASDSNGEPRDFLFYYNSGYWRICRERFVPPKENLTLAEIQYISAEVEFRRVCLSWNRPPNGSEDHLGFSKASGAILNRILLSAILHMVSLAVTGLGLGLSVPGHIRRDNRTFVAAILYIISGILMSVAVMQYICVVDDEMAPKMKQTPEGETSKYKSDYGWSYVAASMSFMCIETCALVELLLFLRRFPSLEDKMGLVPGLKDKIRRAVLHHEFDEILPARTCSRSSPRISFSYSPENATETAFSDSV